MSGPTRGSPSATPRWLLAIVAIAAAGCRREVPTRPGVAHGPASTPSSVPGTRAPSRDAGACLDSGAVRAGVEGSRDLREGGPHPPLWCAAQETYTRFGRPIVHPYCVPSREGCPCAEDRAAGTDGRARALPCERVERVHCLRARGADWDCFLDRDSCATRRRERALQREEILDECQERHAR